MGKLDHATFYEGDAKEKLKKLPDESVQTAITSPPYWGLRDYDAEGQLGLEETPQKYVKNLVEVFRELRKVLRPDGTFWLNIGDSYNNRSKVRESSYQPAMHEYEDEEWKDASSIKMSTSEGSLKEKDLCLIPSRVALALQRDGWYVRSRIVWNKKSCMPENVDDRPTSNHEYVFLLTKNKSYYYDADAIKEPLAESSKERYKYSFGGEKNETLKETDKPTAVVGDRSATDGKNKRDVWTVNTGSLSEAHFAVYPVELIEPCVLAGSAEGDVVLDPFSGAGTTGIAALKNGRKYVGIDLNEEYNELARKRIREHKDVPSNHDFW
jgi:DNA modification methylase